MSGDEQTIRTIDITPTPEGMRIIIQMLREQIETSQEKIQSAGEVLALLDEEEVYRVFGRHMPLLIEAVEALITQEEVRIQKIEEGLNGE